jgi:hypothetical protein
LDVTGWRRLDAAIDWVRRRPVTFFLACTAFYLTVCILGF